MIKIFKASYRFFKMWFLPMPPHDYYEAMEKQADENNTAAGVSGEGREPMRIETEEVYKAGNTQPEPNGDQADGALLESADDEPETDKPAAEGPDFSHLVKAPVGSESRASRGKGNFDEEESENADARDGDDIEPQPEIATETLMAEGDAENAYVADDPAIEPVEEESDISGEERR